jgi:hypothetical protein
MPNCGIRAGDQREPIHLERVGWPSNPMGSLNAAMVRLSVNACWFVDGDPAAGVGGHTPRPGARAGSAVAWRP